MEPDRPPSGGFFDTLRFPFRPLVYLLESDRGGFKLPKRELHFWVKKNTLNIIQMTSSIYISISVLRKLYGCGREQLQL